MSDYLLYWKYFWEDIAENPNALNEEWHTEQEGFWYKAKEGDNLWVVISGGKDFPNEWRLLQKIVVQEKFYNQFDGRRYELKGNPSISERYDVFSQSDLTDLLQKLEFESGKRIQVRGKAIGNTLQAIRPLTEKDGEILKEYAQNLERHSTDAGFNGNLSELFSESSSPVSKTGAGFGSPEMNRKVEQSAISIVMTWYQTEGWSVESVESIKCGYDLLCRKNSEENHVEVKGVQGDLISFIITAGEVRQSQNDDDFVLCVVTSALTDSPKITLFDSKSFASDFDLSPISYRATLRK
jgi:hypothetical protein